MEQKKEFTNAQLKDVARAVAGCPHDIYVPGHGTLTWEQVAERAQLLDSRLATLCRAGGKAMADIRAHALNVLK